MNHTSYGKLFAKYASLNVLGMIALSCYILADTYFVSKGLGTNGLAALNLAIPIYSFIHGSGLMLGMGGATKYAIAKSQRDDALANRVFTTTLLLTIGIGLLYFLIGLCFSKDIVTLLHANEEVFGMSETYVRVILLFAPMFMLNNVLICFVRNDGAPHLSMMAMISGSISNIILDYVFIFPFSMGMFGAVFATGLAPIISMLFLLPYIMKRKQGFHLCRCPLAKRTVTAIVGNGFPSLVTEVSSGVVILAFNAIIMGLLGNQGVAAYGIIANLSLVVTAVYTGIAQGIQPIISSGYGANNLLQIKAVLRYAIITMTVISLLIYAYVFFEASVIAQVFNSEGDMELQRIAVEGARLYFTGSIFAGFNIIMVIYFTSMERAIPAHIISALRGFVLLLPMAFLLSSLFGMIGVWSVYPISELLVCMVSIGLFLYIKKRNLKLNLPFKG